VNNVARWNAVNGWTTLGQGAQGAKRVVSLESTGNHVYAGGTFQYAYNPDGAWVEANHVARFSREGTMIALTSSPNPSQVGRPVTFTATVTLTGTGAAARTTTAASAVAPTGSITFQDNGDVIPGCAACPLDADGQAVCSVASLTPGSHTIAAVYHGDSDCGTSAGQLIGGQTIDPFVLFLPAVSR
jgi:hypothetical protein